MALTPEQRKRYEELREIDFDVALDYLKADCAGTAPDALVDKAKAEADGSADGAGAGTDDKADEKADEKAAPVVPAGPPPADTHWLTKARGRKRGES